MSLDKFFRLGETVDIGTYTFEPEAIKTFARKYDPQPFHVDAELAKQSVFGGLCASGWHTAAAWMKCNIKTEAVTPAWQGPGPKPEFGPSPGFRNLKWLKPVFAGETVRYTRKVLNHRPLATRPGWHVMTIWGEGHDSTGDKVLEFESAALVKAA
jgi:acyl dehydratase